MRLKFKSRATREELGSVAGNILKVDLHENLVGGMAGEALALCKGLELYGS